MGSSPSNHAVHLAKNFERYLDARSAIPFATFMDLALYDPEIGYYQRDRTRVDRGPHTDYYTSDSHREVFSALVAASAINRLENRDPHTFGFVEIGAEPNGGILAGGLTQFGAVESIGIGDPVQLPDRTVCFSNELFDAQPFHRIIMRNNQWVELGVTLDGPEPLWTGLGHFLPPVRWNPQ
jgi:SAM-dependent MidA family methyltransferase